MDWIKSNSFRAEFSSYRLNFDNIYSQDGTKGTKLS
jgi:hypothetical protein